jgi:hypothetical protein
VFYTPQGEYLLKGVAANLSESLEIVFSNVEAMRQAVNQTHQIAEAEITQKQIELEQLERKLADHHNSSNITSST